MTCPPSSCIRKPRRTRPHRYASEGTVLPLAELERRGIAAKRLFSDADQGEQGPPPPPCSGIDRFDALPKAQELE
jgi:hypothetical protein